MTGRRFGPLMAVLVVMLFAVLVRTARIQVAEHEIWAKEAVNLERRSSLVPYHRGNIIASDGLPLVEDEECYELSFQWREFRRENTLGQIALAGAAWYGTPVSFISDPEELGEQAVSLLKLSPADLARLAGSSGREESEDAAVKRRRAADAAFYLRRIIGLDSRAEGRLRQLMSLKEEARSVLELAALASGREGLEEAVRERCWESLDDIARLELLLERPRGSLLRDLKAHGEAVADAVASRLFQSAFGFSAGRLRTESLARLDLTWLRRSLGWSVGREAQWRERARENWREWLLSLEAPEAALRARFSADGSLGDLLAFLSLVFSSEGASDCPWLGSPRGRGDSELFQSEVSSGLVEPTPLFVSVQRGIADKDKGAALLEGLQGARLSELELGDWLQEWKSKSLTEWSAPEDLEGASEIWREGRPRNQLRLSQWLATRWALEWERDWSRFLVALDEGEGVRLSLERIKSALGDREHFLKDFGRRIETLEESPDYEAVFLLTRYPERFRGFGVDTRTRRTKNEVELPAEDPLWNIIGKARKMTLEASLTQESDQEEFRALRVGLRKEGDNANLQRLVQTLTRRDEQHGAEGIERLMDDELSGKNGYKEREGLAERTVRKGSSANMRPVHGEDVQLTLDLSLQGAASEVINRPDPTDDPVKDEAWFKTPTGAICLITPEGRVLAAASAPNVGRRVAIPHRDGQGAYAHERTLRRYTGLPVGSVFKPFTALWCLEEGLITAEQELSCVPREREGRMVAGYHSVNCHSSVGHGKRALAAALRVSCNAYFAQLGERIGSMEGFVDCAHTFGFDLPTGVNEGYAGRGIPEDYENPCFHTQASFSSSDLERGANGLTVLEGTPLQVARAFAGLATGDLPTLSFIEEEVSARPVRLPISARHLNTVREALIDVAQDGSARLLKDLDVAVKTGSADYRRMNDEVASQLEFSRGSKPAMRKHTWVAGWSPAENPRLIFVVYLHDVGVTSTHSAVFVARQLLERPEVQAYLAGGGQ